MVVANIHICNDGAGVSASNRTLTTECGPAAAGRPQLGAVTARCTRGHEAAGHAEWRAAATRPMKVTTVYESNSLDLFTLVRNRREHF